MKLPTAFIEKYRQLLGDEADAFLASFDQPSYSGFRINPLKNGQPTATIKTAQGKIEYVTDGWFGKVDGKLLDHTAGYTVKNPVPCMLAKSLIQSLVNGFWICVRRQAARARI